MISFILVLGAFIAFCAFLGWVAAIVEDRVEKREERLKAKRKG